VQSVAYAMGYYTSHERRTKQLRVRITPSLQLGLKRLAEVWTHVERVRTGEEDLDVTQSDVVNQLLKLGLEGAWAEIGAEPKTDADLAEIKRRAEKVLVEIRKH